MNNWLEKEITFTYGGLIFYIVAINILSKILGSLMNHIHLIWK